jgi:hypothetical protein
VIDARREVSVGEFRSHSDHTRIDVHIASSTDAHGHGPARMGLVRTSGRSAAVGDATPRPETAATSSSPTTGSASKKRSSGPTGVPARNVQSVLGALHDAMGGGAGDAETYAANGVHSRLRSGADAIRSSELPVLVDCGAVDEYLLNEGAEYLHRLLLELDVAHTYRLVEGAGHLDPAAEVRTREAIRFLGDALQGAERRRPPGGEPAPSGG